MEWAISQRELMVKKKVKKNLIHSQVYARWADLSTVQRTGSGAIKSSDELWLEGLRLSKNQSLHYQLVMNIIRSKIGS